MPETIEPPVAAEKSYLDTPDFDTSVQGAIDAAAAQRAEANGEKAPAAIAPIPEKPPETKPPETKPPEPKPGDKGTVGEDDLPGDIKSEAGKSSWKRLKDSKAAVEKERDAVKAERDAAKAEFEAFKKTAATPAEKKALADEPEYQQLKADHEAKQKQLEEYSERLRLLDVEQHPKFKAYFDNKVSAALNMAKAVAGDKALEILKLPDGEYKNTQLEELGAELTPMKAAQLATVLTRLAEIDGEKAAEIADAKANYASILAEQQKQGEQKRVATENLFKQVTADVTHKDKGLPVFQEREGDAEWNHGVKERLAVAQRAFAGEFKPEEAARAAYWAAAAPTFLTQLNGALEKNAALEKELAELRAVAPNPGGARPGEGDVVTPTTKTGLDAYMDSMAPAFQQK